MLQSGELCRSSKYLLSAAAWQIFRCRHLRGPERKISESAIAVMSAGQFLDGSKAQRELGFQARVSVDDAIRRALKWFRAQNMV